MRRKLSLWSLIPADLLRSTRQELALPVRLGELRGLHKQMIRLSRAVLIAGCEPLRRGAAASAPKATEPDPTVAPAKIEEGAPPPPSSAAPQASPPAAPLAFCAAEDEPPPVPGYAGLGRRRLAAFLKDCSEEQLTVLRVYEAATLRRVTVLRQIDRELAARRLRRPGGAPE